MPLYRSPGIFVKEISLPQRSVAEVESALPAFIGYTERGQVSAPVRVGSMADFEASLGSAPPTVLKSLSLSSRNAFLGAAVEDRYFLHESVRLHFANGGGACVVISVGDFGRRPNRADLSSGLAAAERIDEVTLLALPDAISLGSDLFALQNEALAQCGQRRDRFVLLDLPEADGWTNGIAQLRASTGPNHLAFGAAYTPHVVSASSRQVNYPVLRDHLGPLRKRASARTQALFDRLDAAADQGNERELARVERMLKRRLRSYTGIIDGVSKIPFQVPPSGAMAGIYAATDRNQGVWKAPANVTVAGITGLSQAIGDAQQAGLNADPATGKSINAIRSFPGRGILVWGARTLAGNDNEWRYVSARRFCNQLEESLKQSTRWAVFEPNDANLWHALAAQVSNYLALKWRQGALAGQKPDHAYFVKVGLGSTMTANDLQEGRLIVEVGVALVRPAEFVIIRWIHKAEG